ncbi:hypothetical protein FB45DRAFT_1039282 [Roridomyces roridus]|uniref:Uncharacterized protein n=1 Tax=Roridomyces roridus TaxID=1738132 RepID=A0AAD7B445_9AGAR|nr:hypothetical protein FB45DRAFT_1039282 [Roridomyces roridus]
MDSTTPSSPILPPDRTRALLSSNEPPELSEAQTLQSHISEIEIQLASLRKEAAESPPSPERRAQVKTKRAALVRSRKEHQTILSPLRRMPMEMLGEIFRWTLPCPTQVMFPQPCHPMAPTPKLVDLSPWVLTHVSALARNCHLDAFIVVPRGNSLRGWY